MANCKECAVEINDDDRRWVHSETVYCRECVCEPLFEATTSLNAAQRIFEEAKSVMRRANEEANRKVMERI